MYRKWLSPLKTTTILPFLLWTFTTTGLLDNNHQQIHTCLRVEFDTCLLKNTEKEVSHESGSEWVNNSSICPAAIKLVSGRQLPSAYDHVLDQLCFFENGPRDACMCVGFWGLLSISWSRSQLFEEKNRLFQVSEVPWTIIIYPDVYSQRDVSGMPCVVFYDVWTPSSLPKDS